MFIALLLTAGVEPDSGPDVAIDCTPLTPNYVSDRLSIQLLEDCYLSSKHVNKVIENDLKTRTEKSIGSFNSPYGFCHVTSDSTANNLLLHCVKYL